MAQHCQDLLVTQAMIQSQPIMEPFFLMMHSEHTGAGQGQDIKMISEEKYLNI